MKEIQQAKTFSCLRLVCPCVCQISCDIINHSMTSWGCDDKGFTGWLPWQPPLLCHANKVSEWVCMLSSYRMACSWRWERKYPSSPLLQLSSLLRIHGLHGNVLDKGGLQQESEQCLTTPVTNSSEINLDICEKSGASESTIKLNSSNTVVGIFWESLLLEIDAWSKAGHLAYICLSIFTCVSSYTMCVLQQRLIAQIYTTIRMP